MIAFKKIWKVLFISTKKLIFFSRYLNFVFPYFSFFILSAISQKEDQSQILKFIMSSID